MQRALHLLDQISDVVQVESGPSASEFTSLDDKSLARWRPRCMCQPSTKCVIDHIAKGASSPPGHRLQLGGHILIERQGRSHIMMLCVEHHDVKLATAKADQPIHQLANPKIRQFIPGVVRPTIHPVGFKNADFRDEMVCTYVKSRVLVIYSRGTTGTERALSTLRPSIMWSLPARADVDSVGGLVVGPLIPFSGG